MRMQRLRASGGEPDARFSLANERTFLAYLRTALALFAAGAGAVKLDVFGGRGWNVALGGCLIGLGALASGTSYHRWRQVEEAMRRAEPLPYSAVPLVLAAGMTVLGVLGLVLVLAA